MILPLLPLALLSADPSRACLMDTDCPGNLICQRNQCEDPPATRRAPSRGAVPTPASLPVVLDAPPEAQAAPPPPAPLPAPPPPEPVAVAALQPAPTPPPAETWAPPPMIPAPVAAPAPAPTSPAADLIPETLSGEGYRGAIWGLSAHEFQRLKGVAVSGTGGGLDNAWSDALPALFGASPDALLGHFSSAYVPRDDAHYLFYDGRLVGALVQVGVSSYEPLRTELRKRYKARGTPHKVGGASVGGSLTAEAWQTPGGATRVSLCRLEHPAADSRDLVTSLRLLYVSGSSVERITRAGQRPSNEQRDGLARDLDKLQ